MEVFHYVFNKISFISEYPIDCLEMNCILDYYLRINYQEIKYHQRIDATLKKMLQHPDKNLEIKNLF